MKFSGDNVFEGIPVGKDEASLFARFLGEHDFSLNTSRAFTQDVRKFARWFSTANHERFVLTRVTVRDVTDFRDHLRQDQNQAVSSVNRALVTLRGFFGWLLKLTIVPANPVQSVKELRRQQLAPKGLDRPTVRRLLREVELRQDVRAKAIFSLMLFSGCRVSDAVKLELHDLLLNERSGTAVFRFGKGGKQRSVPLPLYARKAIEDYVSTRPPISSSKVFVGERGPLTDKGVRALCERYGAIIGVRLHPHLLRHTFAHQFLADTQNDLVALAQILGHESLNTTARYTQRTADQLASASDRLTY